MPTCPLATSSALADLALMRSAGIEPRALRRSQDGLGCDDEGVIGGELRRSVAKCSESNSGALQIGEYAYGASRRTGCGPHKVTQVAVALMRAVGKAQASNIHADGDERLDRFRGGRRGSESAHDLRST